MNVVEVENERIAFHFLFLHISLQQLTIHIFLLLQLENIQLNIFLNEFIRARLYFTIFRGMVLYEK